MNASIKIVSKKNQLADGTYPIYLRIIIDRKTKFYKTPYSCNLNEWNSAEGKFNSKKSNYLQSNRILSKIKDDASKILDELIENDKVISIIEFDNCYSKNENTKIGFIDFLNNRVLDLETSKRVSYSVSYRDTIKSLIKFKKNIELFLFEDIDYNFLVKYESFLRKCGCNDGGIGVYMRNIRSAYNMAIKSKIVKAELYPFNNYKISQLKAKKIKRALTAEELQKIIDFNNNLLPSCINARYAYLFSFYLRGMNFTDLAELKWSDIDYDIFSYSRNKTKVNLKIKIPQNEMTEEILDFYKEYRLYKTDYIFPILKKDISEYDEIELKKRKHNVLNYYNKQLKLMAKELGISTNIFFYTARHTFATLSLKKGIHVFKIKQALGHKSIKTTESYLEDFKDAEIDEAFENLI